MGHLVEILLWHLYDYAEGYTFIFSWVALPLAFLSCFLLVKKGAYTAIPMGAVATESHTFAVPVETKLNPRDSVVNQNENNA